MEAVTEHLEYLDGWRGLAIALVLEDHFVGVMLPFFDAGRLGVDRVAGTAGRSDCVAGRVQPRQLAFALPHAESLSRDDFLEGPSNAQALALVENWPDWPSRIMMIVGPEGSGKSHLAAIWAAESGARIAAARALTPANVPGALATGALVVEHLEQGSFDERALFHLMNLAREDEAFVLITGSLYLIGEALEQLGFSPANTDERGLNEWSAEKILR